MKENVSNKRPNFVDTFKNYFYFFSANCKEQIEEICYL